MEVRFHYIKIFIVMHLLLLVYITNTSFAQFIAEGENKKAYYESRTVYIEIIAEYEKVISGKSSDVIARGSGFLISPDGWVMTAKHVLEMLSITNEKFKSVKGKVFRRTEHDTVNYEIKVDDISFSDEADIAIFKIDKKGTNFFDYLCVDFDESREVSKNDVVELATFLNLRIEGYDPTWTFFDKGKDDVFITHDESSEIQSHSSDYWGVSEEFLPSMSGGAMLYQGKVIGVISRNLGLSGLNYVSKLPLAIDIPWKVRAEKCEVLLLPPPPPLSSPEIVIIRNPSFEYFTGLSGVSPWEEFGDYIRVWSPDFWYFSFGVPEGRNVATIKNNGYIYQVLDAVLEKDTIYQLSAKLGADKKRVPPKYSLQLLAGDSILAEVTKPDLVKDNFKEVTLEYTSGTGELIGKPLMIRIYAYSSGSDQELHIDDVKLTKNSTTNTSNESQQPLLDGAITVTKNFDWTPVKKDFNNTTMVLVPAGSFEMGKEGGNSDEIPMHTQIFTKPFWIDETEVTREAYEKCVSAKICKAREVNEFSHSPKQPVNFVDWYEAAAYCEWRGARLPTEAEWEYVARGPDGLVYPWGDSFSSSNLHYGGNSGGKTANVGSYPSGASWVGALDMLGNLWEWTSSLQWNYPYVVDDGRELVEGGNQYIVFRGGAFQNDVDLIRSTKRGRDIAKRAAKFIGFRCARSQ